MLNLHLYLVMVPVVDIHLSSFIKVKTPSSFSFCPLQNCKIHHSVVGLRSCISEGAIIEDTLLMGADYYEVIAPENQ